MKKSASLLAAMAALAMAGTAQHMPFDAGTPPKVYGQYLQRSGKQKWTKKKK